MNHKKVHAIIADAGVQWDPEKWDGDIWDSTDSDEAGSADEFIDAKPVWRRKIEVDPNTMQSVRKDTIEDYTQHEVNDIIERFKQKPGEPLLSWMVRLHDQGAAGITLDERDSKKFLILSSDSFVQDAFRNNHQGIHLLALAALGCATKYPTENDWPASDRQWYTLRDCIQRMKEEGMKAAIFLGNTDLLMQYPLSVTMRNRVIKTAPPAYKNVIMTLLINETGNPLNEVIEKVQQLRDLG